MVFAADHSNLRQLETRQIITIHVSWLLQSPVFERQNKNVPITPQHLLQILPNARPVASFFTPGENNYCQRLRPRHSCPNTLG